MEIIVGGIIEKGNKILMVKEAKKMLWKMECSCRTFRRWRNNI